MDITSFSATTGAIAGTMSYILNDVDRHKIADFAQKEVAIIAERTGDAVKDDEE